MIAIKRFATSGRCFEKGDTVDLPKKKLAQLESFGLVEKPKPKAKPVAEKDGD